MSFNLEHITLSKFILFIFAIIITLILANTYSTVIKNIFRDKSKILSKWISKPGQYIIYLAGFYLSLTKIINFNLPAALAALGVLGAFFFVPTIPVLQNIIAGIFVTFSRPLKDGDYVDVGGEICRVEEINIIKTKLQAHDGKIIYIPNLSLITGNIINFSKGKFNKISLDLNFRNSSEINEIFNLLDEICRQSPLILPNSKEPKATGIIKYFIEQENIDKLKPAFYIKMVSSSKIQVNLTFWISDISLKEEIISSFYTSLITKIKDADVELAD